MTLDMAAMPVAARQHWLQCAIAPRPIGLVSTVNKNLQPNLSPFSFFNLFSANPPLAIFSPARRIRDNTVKHSFTNLYEVPEVVINIVDYSMIHRVNLASAEYAEGVNEFIKCGLTMEPASLVRPPMVKESKIKFECRVNELKPLGKNGGAGNLVFCEILNMHIADTVILPDGTVDQHKLELVGRLGKDWYCKTTAASLFQLAKPVGLPAGTDKLPAVLYNSPGFNRDQLAQLANITAIPGGNISTNCNVHRKASRLLDEGKLSQAWQLLLENN